MDEKRNCTDCMFFCFTPGDYGYYPGEHSSPSLSCAKQVWNFDLYEQEQDTLIECLRSARTCGYYAEPKS